jgi:hypothetical protein
MKRITLCLALLAAMAGGSALATPVAGTTTVDFSNGLEGWNGATNDGPYVPIDSSANGTPAMHTDAYLYFTQYWTRDNQAFLGNYAAYDSVTLGLDVTVNSMTQLNGEPMARDFVVELRDYDKASTNASYSSVWFKLGVVDGAAPGMQHLSVTFDPRSNTLPEGWGGYGDSGFLGGALPPAQTFRRILSDVDEVVFGTATPGFMYIEGVFDLSIDNISIGAVSPVPEANTGAMLAAGLGVLGAAARRRRPARLEA